MASARLATQLWRRVHPDLFARWPEARAVNERSMQNLRALIDAGVAVCGHIGLTPQSYSQLGGYRVQGRTAEQACELLREARALEAAGCFAVVLEMVPTPVAAEITSQLSIPTIGIGAGDGTSGQVQVFHDVLGLYDKKQV